MKHNTALFIFIISLLSSCKKDDGQQPGGGSLALAITKDVSYGANVQQKFDMYLPANRTTATTKSIIVIHGGGWNTGDKGDLNVYIDSLRKREPSYAFFNLNYRLADGADIFPAQENDVKAAFQVIYNKRSEYNISDKFVLLGVSAGGHLALLQGYKYTIPVKPKAIIDFFGPTDLVDFYNNPPTPLVPLLLTGVIGGNPTTHNTMYVQSSPVTFITAQSPPTLILYGGADIVVPPSQSTLLNTRLQTAGVVRQLVFYPTEGHGWAGANLTDSFNKIQAFLAANVN
jgi:acetyl esterase/lipase